MRLEAALKEQAADVRVSLGLPCLATFADIARVVVAELGKEHVAELARLRAEVAEKDRRIAALEAALLERWAAE